MLVIVVLRLNGFENVRELVKSFDGEKEFDFVKISELVK